MRKPMAFKLIAACCSVALISVAFFCIDYLKEREVRNSLVVLDQSLGSKAEELPKEVQESGVQPEENSSQEPVPEENKPDTNAAEEVKGADSKQEEQNKAPVPSTSSKEKGKGTTSDSAPKDTTNTPAPKPSVEVPAKPEEESQPVKEEPKESIPAPEKPADPEDDKVEQPAKDLPTYLPNNYPFSYKEAIENEVIALVNALRKENGLPAFTQDSSLRESARYKSNSMLQHQYFSHSNPQLGGKSMSYLLWEVFNINSTKVGENIAYYCGSNEKITAEQIYSQWYNSAPHREAMLSKDFTRIGVGIVVSPKGSTSSYMYGTQHFAR